MTRTTYLLENGIEVLTLKEAQNSGMMYTTKYTTIPKEPVRLSEKRYKMLRKIK